MAAPTWDPWTLRESMKFVIINFQKTASITLRDPDGNYAQHIYIISVKIKCFCLMVTHSNVYMYVALP